MAALLQIASCSLVKQTVCLLGAERAHAAGGRAISSAGVAAGELQLLRHCIKGI